MARLSTLLLLWSVMGLVACGSGGQDQRGSRSDEREGPPPPTEEELLDRLMVHLVGDPQTQADQDNNALVNLAIDSLWAVQRTNSGLYYQVLDPGDKPLIEWGDRITAHYIGHYAEGKMFDNSYSRKEPLTFYVGNMIAGWNEGLQRIGPGGRIRLLVPSGLGYGAAGLQHSNGSYLVPPDQNLIFDVQVLEVLERASEREKG